MTNNEILNIKFEDIKQYINKAIVYYYPNGSKVICYPSNVNFTTQEDTFAMHLKCYLAFDKYGRRLNTKHYGHSIIYLDKSRFKCRKATLCEFKAIQKWYYLIELQKIHNRTTNRHN